MRIHEGERLPGEKRIPLSFQDLLDDLLEMPNFAQVTDEEVERVKKDLQEGRIDLNALAQQVFERFANLTPPGQFSSYNSVQEVSGEGIVEKNKGTENGVAEANETAEPCLPTASCSNKSVGSTFKSGPDLDEIPVPSTSTASTSTKSVGSTFKSGPDLDETPGPSTSTASTSTKSMGSTFKSGPDLDETPGPSTSTASTSNKSMGSTFKSGPDLDETPGPSTSTASTSTKSVGSTFKSGPNLGSQRKRHFSGSVKNWSLVCANGVNNDAMMVEGVLPTFYMQQYVSAFIHGLFGEFEEFTDEDLQALTEIYLKVGMGKEFNEQFLMKCYASQYVDIKRRNEPIPELEVCECIYALAQLNLEEGNEEQVHPQPPFSLL